MKRERPAEIGTCPAEIGGLKNPQTRIEPNRESVERSPMCPLCSILCADYGLAEGRSRNEDFTCQRVDGDGARPSSERRVSAEESETPDCPECRVQPRGESAPLRELRSAGRGREAIRRGSHDDHFATPWMHDNCSRRVGPGSSEIRRSDECAQTCV